MNVAVQFRDQTIGAARGTEQKVGPYLVLVVETLSAREIIVQRVQDEWAKHQELLSNQPQNSRELSAWLYSIAQFDTRASLDTLQKKALKGFKDGAYLFFWNDAQITDLEARLLVHQKNEALFLRLLPLQGG